jgi:hypothetical protein
MYNNYMYTYIYSYSYIYMCVCNRHSLLVTDQQIWLKMLKHGSEITSFSRLL